MKEEKTHILEAAGPWGDVEASPPCTGHRALLPTRPLSRPVAGRGTSSPQPQVAGLNSGIYTLPCPPHREDHLTSAFAGKSVQL